MQKRAFSKQYQTIFAPIPFSQDSGLYYDRAACRLPFSEDFPYLHYHACYEIGICETGSGLFLSEGQYYSVSEGDCILIPPGQRHYSRSLTDTEPCSCRFVYLKAEILAPLLASPPRAKLPAVLHASEYPDLVVLLRKLTKRISQGDPLQEHAAALRLALALTEAECLFSPIAQSVTAPPHTTPTDEIAAEIAEYISLHYWENTSSAELSDICHLSPSQLRRRFAAVYGMPPIAYRNSLRCHIAAELLLQTNRTIAEIAEQLGYPSPSDLNRMFRKSLHISPSEYRKQAALQKESPKIS